MLPSQDLAETLAVSVLMITGRYPIIQAAPAAGRWAAHTVQVISPRARFAWFKVWAVCALLLCVCGHPCSGDPWLPRIVFAWFKV